MHITNKKIAQELVKDGQEIDNVLTYLQVVKTLVAKYGIAVYSAKFSQKISWINKEIGDVIKFLANVSKKNILDIKAIITIIKQENSDYTKNFQIQCPENIQQDLIAKLDKQFTKKETDLIDKQDWIKIKWEWWSYERSIDKDIDKLLK